MSYERVLVYDEHANFVGSCIKDPQHPKLQTTNLYVPGEEAKLTERLNQLNETVNLNAFWPRQDDPEVLSLLADESFVPIEYIDAEMIDDDHSFYVWQQVPETDDEGRPTGRMIDGQELDRNASVITYKMGRVAARPTDVMWRIKQASEAVARKRAGI
jgi:hypothetical protein